jgi:hypothetical protein
VTPDDTVRLLDAAVPPIPPGLRAASLDRIRRRVRNRRTALVTTCAGVAVLTVTLAAGLLGARPGSGPSTQVGGPPVTTAPTPSPSASPTSTGATGALGSFRVARVDRAGTGVTVFVSSPGVCRAWAPGESTVDEQADRVVISVFGAPEPVDCGRAIDTPVEFTLSRPLGTRTLVDGRGQDAAVLVVRDADLPVVPAPWSEVPTSYFRLDGSGWGIGYTTPGGPDLRFAVFRGQISEPVLEQVRIGGHDAVIVDLHGQEAVCWVVGDLVYSMTLIPTEGATTSREELHGVLAHLT